MCPMKTMHALKHESNKGTGNLIKHYLMTNVGDWCGDSPPHMHIFSVQLVLCLYRKCILLCTVASFGCPSSLVFVLTNSLLRNWNINKMTYTLICL